MVFPGMAFGSIRWGSDLMNRLEIHLPSHVGDKIADAVVAGMGSWKFIIIQTVVVILWIFVNILVVVIHYDPYPFILLNLVFSTQAAYASPLILMAANRASQKDRLVALKDDQEIGLLLDLQKEQLQILNDLKGMGR